MDPKSVDVWGRLRPVLTRGLTTAVVPIVGCLERESLRRDCVNLNEVSVSGSRDGKLRNVIGLRVVAGANVILSDLGGTLSLERVHKVPHEDRRVHATRLF